MPLRCLLFSSNEEMVQPIWQVLADLGIEGEYCESAVDAVEKVTTQLFQIVITDWDDQPEAGFLLKTARDLKAAHRPLTLAIVSDDARLPEALRAGANSVLVKPIRSEQVRDTMSTACELLRAKQQPGTPTVRKEAPETTALAAAASAGAVPPPVSMNPASMNQAPEKTFRAGEFLQSQGSAPGGQFDTECEMQKSMDRAAGAEVDTLTELEPTAAAMQDSAAEAPAPELPQERQEPLSGWAALQARLTKVTPPPAPEAPAKNELLSYGETPREIPSHGGPMAGAPREEKKVRAQEPQAESGAESALFAYIAGEKEETTPAAEPGSKLGKILVVGILAAACVAFAAVPRGRQSLRGLYRNTMRAGRTWLNPPPAPAPQVVAQHDSFGQSGDEYNLPTIGNIPDATTDPSQIRVVPVIDPTAKPQKGSDANGGQAIGTTADNGAADHSQTDQAQGDQAQTDQAQTNQNPTDPSQAAQSQGAPAQVGESSIKGPTPASIGDVPGNGAQVTSGTAVPAAGVQPSSPVTQVAAPPRPVTAPAQNAASPQVSTGNNARIPSSLKSQIASSSTPEASGAMPPEAAMSSIEPVKLPESMAWEQLAQKPVDPVYPDVAKASGQRGSVVLQVLIGRDGAVQDAKFLQGSLVFARAAIDAVKQWHFKPYSMNGRAVSVQSTITLNFKPPA
jgi:TonB family protein